MPLIRKRVLFFIGVGLILGGVADVYLNQRLKSRNPAQAPASAFIKANPKSVQAMGKQDRLIAAQIVNVSGTPKQNEKELILEAKVTLHGPVPNNEVYYSWSLPKDADVVSGHIEDSWANIKQGQTATAQLTLTGISSEDAEQHIIFHAYYLDEKNVPIYSSAVFSTLRNDENAELPQ